MNDGISPGKLVGLVVTRSNIHDSREMASLEESNASDQLATGMKVCYEIIQDLQESEDIKLSRVVNTCMGKCEDGPRQLQESDVKRNIDSGEDQVRGHLTKHISCAPDGVGIVELFSVKRQVFLHPTVCITCQTKSKHF